MNITPQLNEALHSIDGHDIEAKLIDFARIGGTRIEPTPEQPERYATGRVALTNMDVLARNAVLAGNMVTLGMDVHVHPLGLVATLPGVNKDLSPVTIMSHTDTVPEGDMYDGVLGVLGGLEAIRAIVKHGVVHKRGIQLIALTGEESSRFGVALFGSKGMFSGLNDKDLNAQLVDGPTIGECLGEQESKVTREPIFGLGRLFPVPHAVIELHVEQNDQLDTRGINLGVVDRIAAPVRHEITFGETALAPETQIREHEYFFELCIEGVANHSGACPMGYANRADGLVEAAQFMKEALEQDDPYSRSIAFGKVSIEGQALNKIPGKTTIQIRLNGSTEEELEEMRVLLDSHVEEQNQALAKNAPRFGKNPFSLNQLERGQGVFFDQKEMRQRQFEAAKTILAVNTFANNAAFENVVGTIGTFNTSEGGVITLGLDLRGVSAAPRDAVFNRLNDELRKHYKTASMGPRRPGGSDPVELDPGLVETASEVINLYRIGTQQKMFSAAGHDAQNSARAGVPSVLLFVPSEKGGIAHHPDAYTSPAALEKGVKALLALVVELANA